MAPTVISYGGGVQSTAMLVLAAQGKLEVDAALFANVGDDSERKATMRYFHEYAVPFAAQHGIPLHELHRVRRNGEQETLLERLNKPGSRSIDIPIRVRTKDDDWVPGNRNCTGTFKLQPIAKWLTAQGATEANPSTVYVGISLDEIHRANRRRSTPNQLIEYPLLDMKLRRVDCERIISSAGLPVPSKSACWFCPMRRAGEWLTMRIEDPDEFQQAVELEDVLLARREEIGKDPAYFTRLGGRLEDVIPDGVEFLPLVFDDDSSCDSGWCMT